MRAPVVFGLLAAMACDPSPTGPTVPLDREFVLQPGTAAIIENASIRVRFDGVLGDSRCPADVMCVWAGDAVVRIVVIEGPRRTQEYELHTVDMKPVQHGDLTIALVQLQPYRFTTGEIRPEDYRATLRVTR
jgi:hypothetical protein